MKKSDAYYKSIIGISSKGELLKQATLRYPSFAASALDTIANIHRVSKEWDALTSSKLEEHNLSLGKLYTLIYLVSEEACGRESASPSDIADALGVTRPTVTSLLDGLERDDYIARRSNAEDRRTLFIELTDKSRKFLDSYVPQHCDRLNKLMAKLNEDDRATLMGLLARIDVGAVEGGE
ncbi:MAG TPA: MarR family transcriptional regulator [Capsulimonadaceae bacterium]|jgi:DNA-binding MarR family transcriptional regulator